MPHYAFDFEGRRVTREQAISLLAAVGLTPTPPLRAAIHATEGAAPGFDRLGLATRRVESKEGAVQTSAPSDSDAETLTMEEHLSLHPEDRPCPVCEGDPDVTPKCPRCLGDGRRGEDCYQCGGEYCWFVGDLPYVCTYPGCRCGRRVEPVDYRAALIDGADGGVR